MNWKWVENIVCYAREIMGRAVLLIAPLAYKWAFLAHLTQVGAKRVRAASVFLVALTQRETSTLSRLGGAGEAILDSDPLKSTLVDPTVTVARDIRGVALALDTAMADALNTYEWGKRAESALHDVIYRSGLWRPWDSPLPTRVRSALDDLDTALRDLNYDIWNARVLMDKCNLATGRNAELRSVLEEAR